MANPKQTPWAILLCKFKDDQSDPPSSHPMFPTFMDAAQAFFTTKDAVGYNAVRFFQEMSHQGLDLSGSTVFGWLQLDVNKDDNPQITGPDRLDWMIRLARQAASQSGVQLANFYGDVVSFNVALGGAFGGSLDNRPFAFGDYRWVQNNGTESFGQEMGHGYGLDHSRRDGSDVDYQDPWDVMSTAAAYYTADPEYDFRGPGLNAANMRGRGWLDESRVWHGPSGSFDQTVQLRPLHKLELPGFLAAELPPNDGDGGHGRYLVEFRLKEGWDAGIPRSCVLIHRFEGPVNQFLGAHSYIMSAANGQQDLVAGDAFAPWGVMGPQLEVQSIDDNGASATIRIISPPPMSDATPALAGVGDSICFYLKSLDGRIFSNHAILGQGGYGWMVVEGDGRTDSAPAAGAVGTHEFVAVKGLDGNTYLNQTDLGKPFGLWFPMNFQTDAAPAVAGVGNSVYFFAKHLDGRIFYNLAALGQGGQGWVEVDGNGRTDAAPAAGAVGTHVFVAVKGPDGNTYLNQTDLGNPFGQWFPMNFQTDAAPAVAGVGNSVYFFAKHLDGRIFYNLAALGQGGQGWVEVDGNGRTNAAPAAGAVGTHVCVAVKGLDGFLYLNQADLGQPFGPWVRFE